MDKEKTLECCFNGCHAVYTMYVALIEGIKVPSYLKKDKSLLYGARLMYSSSMLLAIKESLVDLDENIYVCKSFTPGILKAVKRITNKINNKYYVGDVYFSDAAEFIFFIRNKLAHGEFTLEPNTGMVTFSKENQKFSIHVNYLNVFAVELAKMYLVKLNQSTLTRDLHEIIDIENPISTDSNIRMLIDSFKSLHIVLKRNNSKKIDDDVVKEFMFFVEEVKKVKKFNNFAMIQLMMEKYQEYLNRTYGEEYTVTYDLIKNSFTDEEKNRLVNSVKNIVGIENLPKEFQIEKVAEVIRKNTLSADNIVTIITSCVNMLFYLQTVEKSKSLNPEDINKCIEKEDMPPIEIDGSITLITMFQSLFSYGLDDMYKDVDYSIFDTSNIDVKNYTLNLKYYNELELRIVSSRKELLELDSKISSKTSQLENIKRKGKTEIIETLNNNLKSLEIRKQSINEYLNSLLSEQSKINIDESHLYNEAVITGIRNSIAHGHYRVVEKIDSLEPILIFEDIYEGVLTFSCEVKLSDFYDMIYRNAEIIVDLINAKYESKDKSNQLQK